MPQSGSEDEDEALPTEGVNEKIQATNEAMFPQYPKTQSFVEPDLLRTPDPATSAYANECELPGPMSRDDEEDSSPLVQDLDLGQHIPCSTCDMTTSGHMNP